MAASFTSSWSWIAHILYPLFFKHTDHDPWDINCGLCEEFAIWVIDKLGGENTVLSMVWVEDLEDIDVGHAVICLDGVIYFDAECPEGVSDLHDIPLVKNMGLSRAQAIAERGH